MRRIPRGRVKALLAEPRLLMVSQNILASTQNEPLDQHPRPRPRLAEVKRISWMGSNEKPGDKETEKVMSPEWLVQC